MSAAPRVVVTDGEERAALAACRGLARAGYAVTVAHHVRLAPAAWSRVVDARIRLPDPRHSSRRYVAELAEQLRSRSWDVVLPGSEASLLAISAGRDHLEPYVRLGLPPHPVVLDSLDKVLLLARARGAGLDAPESVVCKSVEAVRQAAETFGYPLVLKPVRSFRERGEGVEQVSVEIVDGDASLDAALLGSELPVTVQRLVGPARIVSCAGVQTGSGLVGFTVARYDRIWPPAAGDAAFARTIAPPQGLRDRVDVLTQALGWSGIFELELLELDGRLLAIDFNPRVFGWISLAIAAGANLPAVWCDHVLERAAARPSDAAPGWNYRWEEGELKYLVRHLRLGERRALVPLLPHRRVVRACFRLSDPVPLAAQALLVAARVREKAGPGGHGC